jgi:hypothetical protein
MRLALRVSILALGVLLAAPAAAPAGVLQVVTPENRLAEGPVLSGARVAWEENRCASRGPCGFETTQRYRIRAAGPGGVRTLAAGRIRSLPGGSNALFESVSFGLSPQRFVVAWSLFGTTAEQDYWEGGLLTGAPSGGRLRHVPGGACRAERQNVELPFALAGAVLAYDQDPCDDRPRLVLRDSAAGTVRRIDLGPPGGSLTEISVAGRWVASTHGGLLQVHDLQTGTQAFSAPLPPGTLHGIDVARDGRVAVTVGADRIGRRTCHPSRLWIRDAGGTSLELKRPQPCWDARLTRDGVVYLRGGRRPARLELLLPGGSMRVIAEFGAQRVRETFDAQHMRAAFAVSCGGRFRIRVVSLGKPARAC